LLANSRADLQYDDDDSDTSSLLVFHALTKELSQSEEFNMQLIHHSQQQQHIYSKHRPKTATHAHESKEIKLCSVAQKPPTMPASKIDDPVIDFFDKMTGNGKNDDDANALTKNNLVDGENGELLMELIRAEEIFIAHIIVKCLKFCPSAFEGELNKHEIMKLIEKASRFLWTHISSTLENFVLWWNATLPLACRSVGCVKYLREWLLVHAEAPEPIHTTLKSLGEVLTLHVGKRLLFNNNP
jgi:hypothetical protein